jgi:hypothetical protein
MVRELMLGDLLLRENIKHAAQLGRDYEQNRKFLHSSYKV